MSELKGLPGYLPTSVRPGSDEKRNVLIGRDGSYHDVGGYSGYLGGWELLGVDRHSGKFVIQHFDWKTATRKVYEVRPREIGFSEKAFKIASKIFPRQRAPMATAA